MVEDGAAIDWLTAGPETEISVYAAFTVCRRAVNRTDYRYPDADPPRVRGVSATRSARRSASGSARADTTTPGARRAWRRLGYRSALVDCSVTFPRKRR